MTYNVFGGGTLNIAQLNCGGGSGVGLRELECRFSTLPCMQRAFTLN